jgi:hypothetical protein
LQNRKLTKKRLKDRRRRDNNNVIMTYSWQNNKLLKKPKKIGRKMKKTKRELQLLQQP